MVKSKTNKHNNKNNNNTRKNNKFRHTKKIYKKKQHTTRKHKKIQHGGDIYQRDIYRHPTPVDARSQDYIINKGLLSQLEMDFKEKVNDRLLKSVIADLEQHINDGVEFQRKIIDARKRLLDNQVPEILPETTTDAVDYSRVIAEYKNVYPKMFSYLGDGRMEFIIRSVLDIYLKHK